MIRQLISEVIKEGFDPSGILYVSIDTPVYSNIPLETFISFLPKTRSKRKIVIFDEIQYLRNWEVHLKDLVDHFPHIKFIASGSAAAALRLKSQESGAGRFSDFMLSALTFYEFLCFIQEDRKLIRRRDRQYEVRDLASLNQRFVDYLNYGGYPEAVLNDAIRQNQDQFIRNDVIEKVLLKDLPSLYGIDDIPELNRLFSFLAYNAGNEASLDKISQARGLSKPTIKKYIEYLQSAFLIIKLPRIDDTCRTMKQERTFKVYLNNPSMRAALFSPIQIEDSARIGHLAESAIFSQWQHALTFRQLRYARWREGEVDIAYLDGAKNQSSWLGEITWSDRVANNPKGSCTSVR